MQDATVYSGGLGINNKVPAHRLKYDMEAGVIAFEDAVDMLVDRTGELVTRQANDIIRTGDHHSLFPGKDWGLVVEERPIDSAIYRVDVSEIGTYSFAGIRSGLTMNAKMDFVQVQDAIFYTNGYQNGMIGPDALSHPWKESVWPDQRTLIGFLPPPVASHLAYNAGRIYFSLDDMLYYTVFAHLGLYDPALNGERFPSRIICIIPALDGMYVSDTKAIYWLAGLDPKAWKYKKVADYPAKEWGKCNTPVNPSFLGMEYEEPVFMVATKNGPVLCMPGGQAINLIDENVTMPPCPEIGCLGLFDETLIIQSGV